MNTLIIYDNDGNIFSQITGSYALPNGGVQYLEVGIPEGKYISGIDVSSDTHTAIFVDVPKTELENIKEVLEEQEAALIEIAEMLLGGNE